MFCHCDLIVYYVLSHGFYAFTVFIFFLVFSSFFFFFFSSRRRHTRFDCDWSSDVCSSDLVSFAVTNGANPQASLTLGNDGSFYGTTYNGGAPGSQGTIFRVTAQGVLTTLISCLGSDRKSVV